LGVGSSAYPKDPAASALDLEEALKRADLVIAARVTEVSQRETILGGKQAEVRQQLTFQPIKRLKGVFARDSLRLTSDDLNAERFDESHGQIERGQVRLLILGRSSRGYANANPSDYADISLTPLNGENDPLLGTVETLIATEPERDRTRRVALISTGLKSASGKACIPLLFALQRRSVLAAQTPGTVEMVARCLNDPMTDVREVSVNALRSILASDYLNQEAVRAQARDALVTALGNAGAEMSLKVALTNALGAAGPVVAQDARALKWLDDDAAVPSFAELAARIRGLGSVGAKNRAEGLAERLAKTQLDAPSTLQTALVEALTQLDVQRAATVILERIRAKHAAGLGLWDEIFAIRELPVDQAVPTLLEVGKLSLATNEKLAVAHGGLRVPDARLVPLLATFLDPRHADVRSIAVEALLKVDTDASARALRPHLAEEGQLPRKLRMAAFLGRHRIRDGYAYAIEHMSEGGLLDDAVDALAAINDPKTFAELGQILNTSHDFAWNRAAVRALGKLGERQYADQILEWARDAHQPLAPSALIALADLGDARVLPLVREGLSSRNDEMVVSATRAAAVALKRQGANGGDIRDRLAGLLTDPDGTSVVRSAALEALVALKDDRLDRALAATVRDANLESSELLGRVETLLKERKVVLAIR
jgi:HEAT repeat protein